MNEMMFQIYPLVCVENIPGKREDEKTNKSGKNIAFFVHRSSLIKTNIDSNKHFPSTYFHQNLKSPSTYPSSTPSQWRQTTTMLDPVTPPTGPCRGVNHQVSSRMLIWLGYYSKINVISSYLACRCTSWFGIDRYHHHHTGGTSPSTHAS
jgi:hypothetical protein